MRFDRTDIFSRSPVPKRALLAMGLCLIAGCDHDGGTVGTRLPATNMESPRRQAQASEEMDEVDRDRDIRAALAAGAKLSQERLQHLPTNEATLPNFDAGGGLPRPIGRNFYEISKSYPGYLLCTYDVSENHYDQSNEGEWFKAALLQIRGYGQSGFPPIKWIAVIIVNRSEFKGEATFEQIHKTGAVFSAADVFDMRRDLGDVVARAQFDRHPFQYDRQSTSEAQQRWLILERHTGHHTETRDQLNGR